VLGNLRERTFEQQVKKYTAIRNAPRPAAGVVAAAGPSVALPGTSGPGPLLGCKGISLGCNIAIIKCQRFASVPAQKSMRPHDL
jgi:hypothetical protein